LTESITLTSGVAGRYATALFSLGKEEKTLDRFETDLLGLHDCIEKSKDFQRMIASPVYKRIEQQKAIIAISKKIKCSKNIQNLLNLMAKKRRLFVLPNLIEDFRGLMENERGEVRAEVISARDLTKVQRSELEQKIKSSIGKEIKLNVKVDETVLGGLVIKVGSKMIDTTIKSKLVKLQKIMKEVS
jgi:F-type H+-transporting ATPase subunit delta